MLKDSTAMLAASSPSSVRDVSGLFERMEDEHRPIIRRSMDYSRFQFMSSGNRGISQQNLAHKRKTLMRHGFLKRSPISCYEENGMYYITDGQHRFEICREEKIPFWYQVIPKEDALKEMVILNSDQMNWKEQDFAKHHSDAGNKYYQVIEEFHEKYKINRKIIRYLVNPAGRNRRDTHAFKNGEIVFDLDQKEFYEQVFTKMTQLKDIGDYKFRNHSSFNQALLEMVLHENYSHERMKEKLLGNPEAIRAATDKKGFLRMLVRLYNKGLRSENHRLSFHCLRNMDVE